MAGDVRRLRLEAALDRLTSRPRQRHAETLFWGERPRVADRLLAGLFFAVSAPEWGRRGATADHVAPFVTGLERCRPPRRVLDLGTGTGASAAIVATRHPDARVRGVDGSKRMIRIASGLHELANLEFERASFDSLPFSDHEFDLVCMLNALPELRELDRVAAHDAQVLVANTYFMPMRDEKVERLRGAGFERVDVGTVGAGSWQLFERHK